MRFLSPLLTMAAMLLAGTTLSAQNPDSARITSLLRHAKEHAAQANLNAERIETYTRSKITWESHAAELNRMKGNINDLGKDVGELSAARAEGSPWQQQAIDDIDPLLRSMADHLSAMIKHLSENQNRVHMPAYEDYAKANYEFSQKLLAMINDYIEYEQAKSTAESLEQRLQIGAASVPGEQ